MTPAAVADPDPENNENAVSRTLLCDNGQTLAATFAGGGSNFNVTIDERVFVYKFLHVDRPPVGEEGPNDDLNVRGLQGFDEEELVTCRHTTPSGQLGDRDRFLHWTGLRRVTDASSLVTSAVAAQATRTTAGSRDLQKPTVGDRSLLRWTNSRSSLVIRPASALGVQASVSRRPPGQV